MVFTGNDLIAEEAVNVIMAIAHKLDMIAYNDNVDYYIDKDSGIWLYEPPILDDGAIL
jgi:hypothetical protein